MLLAAGGQPGAAGGGRAAGCAGIQVRIVQPKLLSAAVMPRFAKRVVSSPSQGRASAHQVRLGLRGGPVPATVPPTSRALHAAPCTHSRALLCALLLAPRAGGIPDFRGPSGVWTVKRAGLPVPPPKVSFAHARPSITHQALLALLCSGKLTFVVSQNVDGLHLRSGVPRGSLAELHGNCFAERCRTCGAEHIRDFEIETVGFKKTGRRCSKPGCGGPLVDHSECGMLLRCAANCRQLAPVWLLIPGYFLPSAVLDWEDELPPEELEQSGN